MEFYKVLQSIMDERKMSIPEVARACELSDSTVRSIIDRKAKNVSLEVAFKMQRGLNVSLQRLNGEVYELTPKDGDELLRLLDDPINRGIFEKLKAMSPEARKVALAQLDALAKYPDREDKK